MQDAYSNRNVEWTTLIRLHRFHVCSILGLSVLLSTIRYINYRFTPPFIKINNCNNISVDEQANIAGVHQLYYCARTLSIHLSSLLRAILFAERDILTIIQG